MVIDIIKNNLFEKYDYYSLSEMDSIDFVIF